MRIFKLLGFLFISFLYIACGSGNQKPSSLFEINLEGNTETVHQNEVLGIGIKNVKNKEITNVDYTIDNEKLEITENKMKFQVTKLRNKVIKATIR